MHRTTVRLGALYLGAWACTTAAAQNGGAGGRIYPEKLREDVEVLRRYIHQTHPDPYRYVPAAEIDRLAQGVKDSVALPLAPEAFMEQLLPLFRAVGDAHFHPMLAEEDEERLVTSAPLLPIRVRILGGQLYVEEELKGFRSLPPGARIVSINGHPAAEVLARIGAGIVCDGANTTYRTRLIERQFPALYHRFVERPTAFRVRYATTGGVEEERTIFAMTGAEMGSSMKPSGATPLPWGAVWVQESSTLWVTLRTLEADSLTAADQRPETFLSSMLKELRQNKAHALVLDLRGAGGKELGMAELVFGSIAREPFRVLQGMSVRSTAPPEHYHLAVPQPAHYEAVAVQFMPSTQGPSLLRPDDHRLERMPPAPKAFNGKVYVVCDGMTRDAAAALVMMVRRTGRGRVVGEETGTNATSFTGGRELLVTLPNSGVRFTVPLMRYVPEGLPSGPPDHGELPNHPVELQPDGLVRGRDTVREALLEMIRELQ